jgi:hypothetical protein
VILHGFFSIREICEIRGSAMRAMGVTEADLDAALVLSRVRVPQKSNCLIPAN